MSSVISESRGAFHRHTVDVGTSSIIHMSELDGIVGQNSVLVQNFGVRKREKQGVVQCFDNTTHVYAFGQDPSSSSFSVTLLVFLNGECNDGFKSTGSLGQLLDAYKGMRVSQSPRLVSMNVDGHVLNGTATGIEASMANPAINTAVVSFMFTDFTPPTQN